jgi:hypothetical protein
MKNVIFVLTVIVSMACNTQDSPNYPTSGIIELTEGKLDTLSTNIKMTLTDAIKKGAAGIYAYEQDSIYNLEWISWADSLPEGTIQRVRFNYHAKNIASRTVRRKSEAYLNTDLTVLGYKDLIFVDAMTKDSIKNSLRTVE